MRRLVFFFFLNLLLCTTIHAQEASDFQQRAENENKNGNIPNARSLYIRAFSDYMNKGDIRQSVECGVKATALYYKENLYKEAFDLLRQVDMAIINTHDMSESQRASLRYLTTKERMQMYIKLRKSVNAKDQIENMERYVNAAADESLRNDLLYNKAIYFYTFGQNAEGNAVFKEMADKLTAQKEYDKVDDVYQTLIANGRKSNNANLVAQSYSSYILWKDSVNALKAADEINALKQQIADNETTIGEKDDSLASRKLIIVGLCILSAALAVALALVILILLRFIVLTQKQKKIIKLTNENNALKAEFIKNISAQLHPSLQKLDQSQPIVKALLSFTDHVQILSRLESVSNEKVELEDTQVLPFCEELMNQIRSHVDSDVELMMNVPKMSVQMNQQYVSHILLHLLNNAAKYTPKGGHIRLEFKKRGAHSHQFIVLNTGEIIPAEKREDIFKPFLEIKDLTQGDGLGLPICKQMALKMNGDLNIDPEFTKGTRFVLSLHD